LNTSYLLRSFVTPHKFAAKQDNRIYVSVLSGGEHKTISLQPAILAGTQTSMPLKQGRCASWNIQYFDRSFLLPAICAFDRFDGDAFCFFEPCGYIFFC
jgi:hypothetical protein